MVWNCGAPHLKFSLCVEIHAQGNPRIGLKINCEFFKICTNTDIHNGSITAYARSRDSTLGLFILAITVRRMPQ